MPNRTACWGKHPFRLTLRPIPWQHGSMSGFLFAFIALLITGIGARDQLLVAALAERRGQRPAALLVGAGSAAVTAAIAAAGAAFVIPLLNGSARLLVAALALALAGAEMLIARASPTPQEPTDSLGAFALVLFAQQLTDAARFVLFGIAVATGAILPAAIGGAAGGAGVVAAGWLGAGALARRNLIPLRRGLGAVVLALAAALALRAMGRI